MTPSIEELHGGEFRLLAMLSHRRLADFVVDYFFRRGSWVTRLHHGISAVILACAILIAYSRGMSFLEGLAAFGLALVALFVVILPLHEALHAIGYALVGARDIRWDGSLRMLAVWVIAHRFVTNARPFIFVALLPTVVLNAIILIVAAVVPKLTVFLLFLLLWHHQGASGDWSLLNFFWLHRREGVWTYDDAETEKSFFFGRAR
ncbi:MAG TPA: DUF3267 domain-containing protein [Thermoanaerobaculia bacterium]|jgi:hypothetical protein